MSRLRRIVNNSLISLFGQIVTWTSTLFLTIAYGRFLGDVKYGELYFAIAFVSLVGFPLELGFNQQITRDVAEDPEKAQAYLWNTLLIKMMLWVLAYGVLLLLSWMLGYNLEQRSLVAICGITLMSASIVNTFAALHYAFERTLFPAVGMILEKGVSACVGFILLRNGATVQTMAFVLLGGSLIDAIWVAIWFFRVVGRRIVIDKPIIYKLIRGSIPFLANGVLGVIYSRIDTVLLFLMTSAAVIGWYGAGYRLYDTLFFLPNIIVNFVMYPIFAKLSASSPSSLRMAVEKCTNLLLICAMPIAGLMFAAAPNIIGFLYHRAEFVNSIPVLQVLAPCVVFVYINTLLFTVIVSTKGEKKIPVLAGIALVFNVGLNIFLIPHYRQTGAALVTTLTELLLFCMSFIYVPGYALPRGSLKVGVKALLAALVMMLAVFLLRTSSIFIIFPIALLVYSGMAVLLKTVPREEVLVLYRVIMHKDEESSTNTLEISQVQPEVRAEMDQIPEDDDDITERLPAVRTRRARSEAKVEPEMISEEIDYKGIS